MQVGVRITRPGVRIAFVMSRECSAQFLADRSSLASSEDVGQGCLLTFPILIHLDMMHGQTSPVGETATFP